MRSTRTLGGATVAMAAVALTVLVPFSAGTIAGASASPAVHLHATGSHGTLPHLIATPDGPPWGPCGC